MFSLIDLQVPKFDRSSKSVAKKPLNFKTGEAIEISCTVRGRPQPTVDFYKDSVKLQGAPNNTNILSRVDIQQSVLRIRDASIQDSGKYQCVAINSVGNQSLIFDVTVNDDKGIKIKFIATMLWCFVGGWGWSCTIAHFCFWMLFYLA